MKKSFEKICAIRIPVPGELPYPVFAGIIGDRVHWNAGGESHAFYPDIHKIIEEYEYDRDEMINEIRRHHLLKYCPQPSKPQSGYGWISPDGLFFKCPMLELDFLAEYLAAKYHSADDGFVTLEKMHWIRAHGYCYEQPTFSYTKHITQPQLDAIWGIIVLCMDECPEQEDNLRRLFDTLKKELS
jgi:hypothetical protein